MMDFKWLVIFVSVQTLAIALLGLTIAKVTAKRGRIPDQRVLLTAAIMMMLTWCVAFLPYPGWFPLNRVVANQHVDRKPSESSNIELWSEMEVAPPGYPSLQSQSKPDQIVSSAQDIKRYTPDPSASGMLSRLNLVSILAFLALSVSGFAASKLIIGMIGIRRMLAKSCQVLDTSVMSKVVDLSARLGYCRHVKVLETPVIDSPATIGTWNPTILLPIWWRNWTDDQLRAVVAHEMSHIASRDHAKLLVVQINRAIHWYNPGAHIIANRMLTSLEFAADLNAARLIGGPRSYLFALASLTLDKHRCNEPTTTLSLTFVSSNERLEGRIQMLRNSMDSRLTVWKGSGWVSSVCIAISGLLILGLRPDSVSRQSAEYDAKRWAGKAVPEKSDFGGTIKDETVVGEVTGTTLHSHGSIQTDEFSGQVIEALPEFGGKIMKKDELDFVNPRHKTEMNNYDASELFSVDPDNNVRPKNHNDTVTNERVQKLFVSMRDGTYNHTKFPELGWEDIPALLELGASKTILTKFPINPFSSYAVDEYPEGMVALWLVEGIRTRKNFFASLNALCLPPETEAKDWSSESARSHDQINKAYNDWWMNVRSLSSEDAAKIDPLEGTKFQWYGASSAPFQAKTTTRDQDDVAKGEKSALRELQGKWKLETVEHGKTRAKMFNCEWAIEAQQLNMNWELFSGFGSVLTLQPIVTDGAGPSHGRPIDLVLVSEPLGEIGDGTLEQKTVHAIYEVEGDRLRFAWRSIFALNTDRPDKFRVDEDDDQGVWILTFSRIK